MEYRIEDKVVIIKHEKGEAMFKFGSDITMVSIMLGFIKDMERKN